MAPGALRKKMKTVPRCWGKPGEIPRGPGTWDVTPEQELSPTDLFKGKTPVGALIGLLEQFSAAYAAQENFL